MAIALCALALLAIGASAPLAQAADFQKIDISLDYDSKTGKTFYTQASAKGYTFRGDQSNNLLVKQNGRFKKTGLRPTNNFTDGKIIYGIKDSRLYSYSIPSGKLTRLTGAIKLSRIVSAVYGGNVYVDCSWGSDGILCTKVYSVSKEKVINTIDRLCIEDSYGKWAVAKRTCPTDISPFTVDLYKLTKSGAAKVRTLATSVTNTCFAGNKLFYVRNDPPALSNARLYSCNADGTSPKRIASFKGEGHVSVYDITKTSCSVLKRGKNIWDMQYFTYIYKTKVLKPKE